MNAVSRNLRTQTNSYCRKEKNMNKQIHLPNGEVKDLEEYMKDTQEVKLETVEVPVMALVNMKDALDKYKMAIEMSHNILVAILLATGDIEIPQDEIQNIFENPQYTFETGVLDNGSILIKLCNRTQEEIDAILAQYEE